MPNEIVEALPVIYSKRRKRKWRRMVSAMWHDTTALWNEFRFSVLVFIFTTIIGGMIYGELHDFAKLEPPIQMIDRPYTIVQLMILSPPNEYDKTPDQWYLIIWWYLLPIILIFIVGNGVADFVRLFFNRDARRDAWREALAGTYRDHIIILGAGRVGMRVIAIIHELMGLEIVVIENSPSSTTEEYVKKNHIPLIRDDGSQKLALEKAGLSEASAFLACTGDDRTNIDAVMRVRSMNHNIHIVARIWDDQFSNQIRDFMKVQFVGSSSRISAPVFAGLTLGVELTQTLEIGGVDYSTLRLTVNRQSFMDGRRVGDLQDENGVDIVLHVSKGHSASVKPDKVAVVNAGDTLVMFGHHDKVLKIAARNRYLN